MPPKKAAAAKSGTTASHPSYRDMIKDAIINLKDRSGSSRQALKKYVQSNNPIAVTSQTQFDAQFNRALRSGVEKGEFVQPKGPSGTVKLAKKEAGKSSAAPAKPAVKKAASTKAAPKKEEKKTTTKKAPAKATTKKAATTKKTATSKTKANITKQRKAPPAPAVVDHPPVLGKTKSGRVTKSTAPQPPKKATPKKKAAAKKATPKKSEA